MRHGSRDKEVTVDQGGFVSPDGPVPDVAAARIMDAVRGGPHGTDPERAIAAAIEAQFPGSGERLREAAAFHSLLAAEAVTVLGARSLIVAGPGYPPSGWDEAELPHLAAVRAVPPVRCLYVTADRALSMLWQGTLAGDASATAAWASAGDPGQVAETAQAAGLEGPWSVQVQLCAHWWTDDQAAKVVAGYADVMPAGSTLVLTVPVPGGVPAGGRMGALVGEAAGTVPVAHSPQAIAGWVAGAGLELRWPARSRPWEARAAADVRTWPGQEWASDDLAAGITGRVVAVLAQLP